METKQFFFKGKEFIITLNGETGKDTVQVIYPNDPNTYIFEFGHEVRMNKIERYVYVNHKEEQWNLRGEWVTGSMKEFQATGQETFTYFYRMLLGNVDDLGTTLDKMVIDGFLIERFEFPQGVFGTDGAFYYPIWFETEVTGDTIKTLTVTVSDQIADEVYTYTLLGSELPAQTSNVFVDVPSGSYTLLVESPRSMACHRTVTIEANEPAPNIL